MRTVLCGGWVEGMGEEKEEDEKSLWSSASSRCLVFLWEGMGGWVGGWEERAFLLSRGDGWVGG